MVDEANAVHNRNVKVGPKIGPFWLITEGLTSDELIVYEGLQKVKEGVTVNPLAQKGPSTTKRKARIRTGKSQVLSLVEVPEGSSLNAG